MTYQLGIDVGTTTVVAAVHRGDEADGAEVVPLVGGGATVPSALHLARDGGVTVGEGAQRLAGIDAGRVIRGLPRHIGDPAPLTLGNATWTAEDLLARLVRWVVDRVAEHEGGPAHRITLAHPPSWTVDTLERLAVALAGVDVHVSFLAEPQAVAQAARAGGEPGDTIAVYDLGGGRFDAAVVSRDDTAFAVAGRAEGLPDVGGLLLDELVWRYVRDGLPEGLVPDAKVRRACLRAKETLSTKAEAVVRVKQGELRGEVRLDRGTFEGLVAAHVDRTADILRRVIASAGLAPQDLSAVLLVGGSSRIPLVARTVSVQLGRPVTVLDDPAWVALGAASAVPAATVTRPEPATVLLPAPALFEVAASDVVAAAPAPSPVDAEPVVPEPVVPEPLVENPVLESPPVVEPVVETPVLVETVDPQPDLPADVDPRPAPRAVPVRTPAVLDAAGRHGARSRSLPRLLVGAGAVAAAALVVVALFRPDGPLDPPLDPGNAASRVSVAPVVPAPPPLAGFHPTPAAERIPIDGAPAVVKMTEPQRPRLPDERGDRPVVDRPVDRAAVDRPDSDGRDGIGPASDVRMTGPRPGARSGAADVDESPMVAETRTPPTPAPPRA